MPELKTMPAAAPAAMPVTLPPREVAADGRLVPKGREKKAAVAIATTAPLNGTVPAGTMAVEQVAVADERPMIYPEERAELCRGANAICEHHAVQILDWLTEAQYQARMMARNPGSEAGQWAFGKPPNAVYMLRDASSMTDRGVPNGAMVRCLNNLDNRPFDERWCLGLAQTILRFQWAGSITISDLAEFVYGKGSMKDWKAPDGKTYKVGDVVKMCAGTINGSSISLSRTGRVESGQHSLCALILACQMYRAAPRGTYPEWDKFLETYVPKSGWGAFGPGPVIETILVTGLSEDRRVLMTVDNCKPRSEMDVFYTSDIFIKERGRPAKRQELSRMLAVCESMFWKRTQRQGYKTHSEVMQLVLDHPKLIKSVEHVFTENASTRNVSGKIEGGSLISNLGLSPGQSACLLYLMGSSASDGDAYRNSKPAPRERGLDWSRWDRAKDFWSMLGSNHGFEPVRRVLLTRVVEFNDGTPLELSGNLAQQSKLAVLAKAWDVFATEGRQFTELDLEEGGCLHLHYSPAEEHNVDGKVVYVPAALAEDTADFGGIDVPSEVDVESEDAPKTQAELEASAEAERRRRIEAANAVVANSRAGQGAEPVSVK